MLIKRTGGAAVIFLSKALLFPFRRHNEKKQHTRLEVRRFVRTARTLSREPVLPADRTHRRLAQDDPIYFLSAAGASGREKLH